MGVFVTFEGPEGAGKSTAIRSVGESLTRQGRTVTITREPGAGWFGAQVRRILLEGGDITPLAELHLFLADRSEHVAKVVRPALERGEVVLCDRHADSTVVYQGYARGADISELKRLNLAATQGLLPALTILIDVPVAEGLGRLTNPDRLDREPVEFHEKVRQGFLTEAGLDPKRWVVVDGLQSPQSVAQSALDAISARLADC